jgi:hypothetical protein
MIDITESFDPTSIIVSPCPRHCALDQLATLFHCRKDCSSLVLDELVLQFGSESHFDFLEYHFGVHDERVCVCHVSIHG